MVSLITLSIPIFFALMAIELIAAKIIGRRVYRLNDAIDDINCGVVSRVRGVLTLGATFALYLGAYALGRKLGIPELPKDSWITWVVALLGVDLAYYWFHRLSHEVNFLWAAHVVHHQSEDYNLAVALRQSAFQGLFDMLCYAPLGFIGVPAELFLISVQLNTLYQFWIHTRLIGRLGPLEWILNTPSHHRVHHGADPKYLDRNYAGVLIIWDRMFGSFQAEEEEPTYGTTKPLARWNPVWANFDYWVQIWRQGREFERVRDRVWLFFAHPGWRPEQPVPTPPEVRGRPRFDADTSRARKVYLFIQFLGTLAATVGLLFGKGSLSYVEQVALCAWILASTVALGTGFEHTRAPRFFVLELARLLLLPLLVVFLLPAGMATGSSLFTALGVAGGFAFVSMVALWWSRPAPQVQTA